MFSTETCLICNTSMEFDDYYQIFSCNVIDVLSGNPHFQIKQTIGTLIESIAIIDNYRISILTGKFVKPRTLIEKYVSSSKLELIERTYQIYDFPLDSNFINNYKNYKILL